MPEAGNLKACIGDSLNGFIIAGAFNLHANLEQFGLNLFVMACLDLLLYACTVGRHFPDKAIDLIDEACATTRMQVAAKQKKLNSSSRQADLGNKAKLVVCADHVAQVGIIPIPYYILPPF